MIEIIKQRLMSDYYVNNPYTAKELYYIHNNEELKELFIDALINSRFKITKDASRANHEIRDIFEEIILSQEYADVNKKTNLFISYMRFYYDSIDYKLDLSTIDESIMNIDGIDKERIYNFLDSYIRENSDRLEIELDDDNINLVLDAEYYDLLYNKNDYDVDDRNIDFYNISDLSEETINRLVQVINEKHIKIPYFIESLFDLPLNEYSDYGLAQRLFNQKDNPLLKKEFESELLKRVKESDSNIYNDKHPFNIIARNGYDFEGISKDDLLVLLKKGVVLYSKIDEYVDNGLITIDEVNEIFIELLSKTSDPINFFNNKYQFRLTPDFKEKIIEEGLGLCININKLSKEEIDRINVLIKNGKNKINYIEDIPGYKKDIGFGAEADSFVKMLIDNNIKIGHIIADSLSVDSLKELIRINPDITLYNVIEFDKELYNTLLESGKYNELTEAIANRFNRNPDYFKILYDWRSDDSYFSVVHQDLFDWLDSHKDDEYLFHKVLKSIRHYVDKKNVDRMFMPVLGNEIITEEIVNFYIHNDNFDDKFSNDFYQRVKNYYSNKNDFNINSMDLIEQYFGPNLIMYFGDDNIKNILKSKEDLAKKLISLFPRVEYSLTDVEAAYESIYLYSFLQNSENDEIKNMFSHLLHAMSDGNEKRINEIKYMILSIVDKDEIEKIKKENGLTFYDSGLSLLDYLIENNSNENNIKVLREITNCVLFSEIKFDRNNHYYINKRYDGNYMDYYKLRSNELIKLLENIPKDALSKIISKYSAEDEDIFYDKIKTNNELYNSFIKSIIRYSINKERENETVGYTIFDELSFPYTLDEKNKKNALEKQYLKDLYYEDENAVYEIFKIVKQFGISDEDADRFLHAYYMDDFSSIGPEDQQKFNIVMRESFKYIKNNVVQTKPEYSDKNISGLTFKLDRERKIKRVFNLSEEKNNMYSILSNLNLNLLDKNVFCDEETTNLLIEVMKKRKIHMIDKKILDFVGSNEQALANNLSDIAGFINYFDIIKTKMKVDNNIIIGKLSITEILKQSKIYSAQSSIYSRVLGEEDARLIKSNPGPNAAIAKKNNERMKEAITDTIQCYNRQKVAIPSFDKLVELPDNKKIEVIGGNFTDPCNITHGERTGACMRIGGAGESLYKFCLYDDNGFHIRLEDPNTGEYISRVSGYRNGNTVFLNQLRDSLSSNYSNDDLILGIKNIADYLIEETKNSASPIENVFITDTYAMNNIHLNNRHYNFSSHKFPSGETRKGLSSFYSDYDYSNAILLSTSSDNDFVPLDTKIKVEKYDVQRSKPVINNMDQCSSKINRIHVIKQLLDGKTLQNSDIDIVNFENGVIYSVISDDWYLYVDEQGQINSEYIDKDPRAKEELDRYREIVEKNVLEDIKKEKKYGA